MFGDGSVDVLCVHTGEAPGPARHLERADDRIATRTVETPGGARARLAESSPDCVLVGEDLPGTDLAAFVDRVRESDPEVPVICYGASERLASEGLDAGVTDVVRRGDGWTDVLTNRVLNAVESYRNREAARHRDRKLRSLLEFSSDRLGVLDERGRYKFVSPAVERLMGYDPEQLLGTSGFEYVHPEDRDRVEAAFERLRENPEDTYRVEYRLRDADGDWRWVESRGTNRLDDPAIAGIVVNSREITERKERERKLGEERAFTESIFAALPDVFYAFDEAGNFLRWNDRLAEVTGYTDEEIASMHPADFVAEEDRETVLDAVARVFEADTTVTVEARFETKDGERIPYEFTGAEVTDGAGTTLGLVGIGRDVSARKQRQRRFEAVFNNTYQFTGLMEPDGTIVEANETALSFGGLDREDVVGTKLPEAYWFQTDDEAREIAREAVEQARTGELYREEVTVQGAAGTETIDFSVRPILDDRGDVTLLIPEGRTITELKQRERHLRVLHRFLRHNLRNKMTVIEGTADLLTGRLGDSTHEEHMTQIREAAAELVELSETAHELLQIAIEADTDRRPVDLDRTLTTVERDIEAEYPEASVDVYAGSECWVSADWRLGAVFEQLVENAVEHAGEERPTVDVTVEESGDGVAVRVADEGPGIPDDELAGITTDEEVSQLTHGTGFGLWLVRSVVDDYGGDIAHESPPEGGSVLVVTLERAPDHQPATDRQGERGET
jgi:PAS domain S-box-containing protein